MKRPLFFVVVGVVSVLFTAYAARQFFFACMACSALAGVPSAAQAHHQYSVLSTVWLAASIAGVLAINVALLAAMRHSSTAPDHGTRTI